MGRLSPNLSPVGPDSAVLDGLSGTGRTPGRGFWDWAVLGGTRRTFVKLLITRRSWVQIPPPPPSHQFQRPRFGGVSLVVGVGCAISDDRPPVGGAVTDGSREDAPVASLTSAAATFLFTDIEASTRRWEDDAVGMSAALARHDGVVADAIAASSGSLLKHTGDGVLALFNHPADALRAAVAIQRALTDEDVRVRVGIHTGRAEQRDGDYFGPTLNRAARIMALGRGGHVLVSAASASMIDDDTPTDSVLVDLGEHLLRDFEHPERIFQVTGTGLESEPALTRRDAPGRLGGRSAFVGRDAEVAALSALLERDRCVTITGIGGSGKTRLALEVADRVASRFEDGVFVVELAPVADPGEVARAIADAVGMPVVSGSVARDLTIFLRPRACLLVLDNCEHLLDACADLVDELSDACPQVSVLATSREALGVDGERSWRAPSLSLPPDAPDADQLQCESAALFVARAAAVRPGFTATEHAAAIAEICRRLDGLPLAIELAAARSSHLSPEQIAAMLDDRFRLLTGGARRARQRQQTLQAAMDWSHDLLVEEERRLLRQLSVFAGGWSLDAAVDVSGGDAVVVIDGLRSLVAKSLVNVYEGATGELRYGMLETVRLYAQERLVEAGEAEHFRDRHCDWLLRTISVADDTPNAASPSRVFRQFEPELENLRAALDWSREQGRSEAIVRLVSGTWPLWWLTLRSFEALPWLDDHAPPIDSDLSTATRVEWRIARGFLAHEAMDGVVITRCGEEALAIDPDGRASPITGLAWFLRLMVPFFLQPEEALRIGREATPWLHAHAPDVVTDVVSVYRADVLIANGDLEAAHDLLDGVLSRSLDEHVLQWGMGGLATICHLRGDDAGAVQHMEAVIAGLPESPSRHVDTWAHAQLAIAEAGRADPTASRARLRVSVECVRRRYGHLPSSWGIPVTAAAIVLAIEGRDDEALQLLVAVGAQRRGWQARQETMFILHHHYASQLATRMAPEDFAAAWAAGNAMSVEAMQDAVDALVAEGSSG